MPRRELTVPLENSGFWTDSTIVLRYIHNRAKRLHTFVANRVATIIDGSDPGQWRYVDTKRNPADEVSRGMSADELVTSTRWRHGPDFLRMPEDNWPKLPTPSSSVLSEDDPEVK
jgi:hypothetical protein